METINAPTYDWLPDEAKELEGKRTVLLAERHRVIQQMQSDSPARQQVYQKRLTEIKAQLEEVKIARRKTQEGLNEQFNFVVADALGPANQPIFRRLLLEATSRLAGNPSKHVNIYPDDVMDAYMNSKILVEQKLKAEAKVHAVKQQLTDAKLSLKGQLPMHEFDRRKAFNDLIDKLLRQL